MSEAAKSISIKQKPLPLLTPEYLPNVPVFTKKYFEELYNRMSKHVSKNNKKFFLVFDNYQDVPQNSAFHDIINTGLSILPVNVNAIFISRLKQ